jgi:HSP20 family protein
VLASMLNFPGLSGDFERLRRELDDWFDAAGAPSSIRSVAPGSFPAINIGNTPTSVEVYAFAPGIDPAKVEVVIDRGVLTLAGERVSALPEGNGERRVSVYSRERAVGRFKRRRAACQRAAARSRAAAAHRHPVNTPSTTGGLEP